MPVIRAKDVLSAGFKRAQEVADAAAQASLREEEVRKGKHAAELRAIRSEEEARRAATAKRLEADYDPLTRGDILNDPNPLRVDVSQDPTAGQRPPAPAFGQVDEGEIGGDVGGPFEEPPVEPDMAKLDAFLKQREAERRSLDIRSSLSAGGPPPDQAALDQELAREAGVEPIEVEQDREAFKLDQTARSIEKLETTAPKVARWLYDPSNLAIAADDADNLEWWEQLDRWLTPLADLTLKPGKQALGAAGQTYAPLAGAAKAAMPEAGLSAAGDLYRKVGGITAAPAKAIPPLLADGGLKLAQAGAVGVMYDIPAMVLGIEQLLLDAPGMAGEAMEEITGKGPISDALITSSEALQRFFQFDETQQAFVARGDAAMPVGGDPAARGFYSGARSIPVSLAAMAATVLTKDPRIGSAIMGSMVGGQSYGEARDEGLSRIGAARYGVTQAGWEIVSEYLGNALLVKDIVGKKGLGGLVMRQAGAEVFGENLATATQDMSTWLNVHPEGTWAEYAASRGDAHFETTMAALFMSAVTATAAKALDAGANAYSKKRDEQMALKIAKVTDQAKASKLLKRSPEAFRSMVEAAAPDQKLYVDADGFEAVAEANGISVGALAQAFRLDVEGVERDLSSGQDIAIKVSDYATAVGTAKKEIGVEGAAIHAGLAKVIRDEKGVTPAMREAYEKVREESETLAAERKKTDQSFADAGERVYAQIREKLAGLGALNEHAIETISRERQAQVETLAHHLGMDPEQAYAELWGEVETSGDIGKDGALGQGVDRQPFDISDEMLIEAAEKLSPQEFETFKAVAEGLGNPKLAARLGISDSNVAKNLTNIRAKGYDIEKLQAGVVSANPKAIRDLLKQGRTTGDIVTTLKLKPGSGKVMVHRERKKLEAEGFTGMAARYARSLGQDDGWYYSALKQVIEKSPLTAASAQQWKGMLWQSARTERSAKRDPETNKPIVGEDGQPVIEEREIPGAPKNNLKAEELAWTGVLEWLDAEGEARAREGSNAPKLISREDLLAFLESNGVVVEEVKLGARGPVKFLNTYGSDREMARIVGRVANEFDGSFDRDQFIDALSNDGAFYARMENIYDGLFAEVDGSSSALAADVVEAIDPAWFTNQAQFESYVLPGGTDYTELLLTLPNIKLAASHWDEPNVVAHVRFKTRTGPNGEKVLAVEEIQSDHHQALRKQEENERKGIDTNFTAIVERMKAEGVLQEVCD